MCLGEVVVVVEGEVGVGEGMGGGGGRGRPGDGLAAVAWSVSWGALRWMAGLLGGSLWDKYVQVAGGGE